MPRWMRLLLYVTTPFVVAIEAMLGIETLQPQMLAAVGPWIPGVCDYEPASRRAVRKGLRRCRIGRGDVLVDVGSGKGRVVLEAARHPCDRVVGIELLDNLHRRAIANARRFRGRMRCREIELVRGDAVAAGIPDDATVLFLFNPFVGDVAESFFARVAESLERNPRRLRLLYLHGEPAETAALERILAPVRSERVGAGLALYELAAAREPAATPNAAEPSPS